MGLTFKKDKKETGLAGIVHPYPTTRIKLNKMEVGAIYPPTWQTPDHKWSVAIMVKTAEDAKYTSGWKWITFKARHDSEEQAREWVKNNWAKIEKLYTLRLTEPYTDD